MQSLDGVFGHCHLMCLWCRIDTVDAIEWIIELYAVALSTFYIIYSITVSSPPPSLTFVSALLLLLPFFIDIFFLHNEWFFLQSGLFYRIKIILRTNEIGCLNVSTYNSDNVADWWQQQNVPNCMRIEVDLHFIQMSLKIMWHINHKCEEDRASTLMYHKTFIDILTVW